MRLPLKVCLLFWIPIALLTIVLVYRARQQPYVSPRLALWKLDSCNAPCWSGLVPGVTDFTQTRDQLTAAFSTLPGNYQAIVPPSYSSLQRVQFSLADRTQFPNSRVEIECRRANADQATLSLCNLNLIGATRTDKPLLAEILTRYGPPDQVVYGGAADAMQLLYRNGLIIWVQPEVSDFSHIARLNLSSSVIYFSVVEGSPGSLKLESARPWQGLASLQRYAQVTERR